MSFDPITAARIWLLIRPISRFKTWRARRRGVPVLQGKLTYASIAVLGLSWLAQRFDIPLLPDDAESVVAAIAALAGTVGGIYGRYRATKAV